MKLQEFGKGIWTNDPQLILADYIMLKMVLRKHCKYKPQIQWMIMDMIDHFMR